MSLQRFQAKTPIQPQQITGNPEAAEAQAVTSIAQDVVKQGEREAVWSAERRGAEAGDRGEFMPAIGGAAAQAYNKAGIQANRYKLNGDISLGIDNIFLNAKRNNIDPQKALEEYGSKSSTFAQSLLAHVPRENQAYARNILVEHSERALMQLQGAADKTRRLQAYTAGLDNIQGMKESMQAAAESGHVTNAEQYGAETLRGIDFQTKLGIMTPLTALRLKKGVHDSYAESYFVGQYKAAKAYDQANGTQTANKLKEDFLSRPKYSKLADFATRRKIISHVKIFDQQQKLANGINAASYTDRKNSVIARARLTGKGANSEDQAFFESKPDKAPIIQDQINDAQTIYNNVHQDQTLPQMDSTVQKLTVQKGETDREEKIRVQTLSDLKTRRDNFIKDPVGSIMESPVYKEMRENELARQKGRQNTFEEEGKVQPFDTKTNANILLQMQRRTGVPESKFQVQPLSQNLQDIATLKNASLDDGLDFLENKKKQLGGANFSIYMRNISGKNGIDSSYSAMMKMSENPVQQPFVIDMKSAVETTEPELNKVLQARGVQPATIDGTLSGSIATNNNIQSFLKTFESYRSTEPSSQNAIVNNIRLLSKFYVTKGMSATDATDAAYKHLYGDRYTYMGENYRVPFTEDADKVRTMMNYIKDNLKNFDLPSLKTAAPVTFAGLSLHSAFKTGHFVNDPADDEKYMYVDWVGRPVITPNGFKLFGKQVDRHYLSFTAADMEDTDFLQHDEKRRRHLFTKRTFIEGVSL